MFSKGFSRNRRFGMTDKNKTNRGLTASSILVRHASGGKIEVPLRQ